MTAPAVMEFKKFAGIKNAQDRTTLGAPFLWSADNVDCDDEGIISRRYGHSAALIAGDYHSGFATKAGTLMLAVQGANLVIANPVAGTTTVLRSDLTPGLRMSYVEVNNEVYYTNGQVYSYVNLQTGALGTFPAISKTLSQRMPAGHLITHYKGRMYIARGNTLFWSVAMDFGRIELRRSFRQFPGLITMIQAVDDGIWISYGKTGFIAGNTPKEAILIDAVNYDAVMYSGVSVDAALLSGDEPMKGKAAVWESTQGPCLGLSGGIFINIAQRKYNPPTGTYGAAIVRKNRKGTYQYLALIHN